MPPCFCDIPNKWNNKIVVFIVPLLGNVQCIQQPWNRGLNVQFSGKLSKSFWLIFCARWPHWSRGWEKKDPKFHIKFDLSIYKTQQCVVFSLWVIVLPCSQSHPPISPPWDFAHHSTPTRFYVPSYSVCSWQPVDLTPFQWLVSQPEIHFELQIWDVDPRLLDPCCTATNTEPLTARTRPPNFQRSEND